MAWNLFCFLYPFLGLWMFLLAFPLVNFTILWYFQGSFEHSNLNIYSVSQSSIRFNQHFNLIIFNLFCEIKFTMKPWLFLTWYVSQTDLNLIDSTFHLLPNANIKGVFHHASNASSFVVFLLKQSTLKYPTFQ